MFKGNSLKLRFKKTNKEAYFEKVPLRLIQILEKKIKKKVGFKLA